MDKLITERLILRPWEITDSKDLYEYAKSDLVGPRAGWKPHKSEEESKDIIKMFIEDNDTLAIVLKSENKVIGGIGLHKRKPDESLAHLSQREVGYVLNPKYWGNGYVPEAVHSIIDYGFNKLKLDLIWCAHYDFNNNSRRVNEKCRFNFRFERKEVIKALDDLEVTTLYYCKFREEFIS